MKCFLKTAIKGPVLALAGMVCIVFSAQAFSAPASDVDFKEVVVAKYGYKLKIPKQFELREKIDKTTDWQYQPGAKPAATETKDDTKKQGKKFGLKALKSIVPGVGQAESAASATSSAGGSQLEPALTIYVNWVWMPDVDSGTSYNINLKSVKEDIASPDPDYRDIQIFSKKKGYKMDGQAFWYKEVDKDDPNEIHRWHIKAFGNKSHYTIGLCAGAYKQFEKWGPIYEEVVKSFELIPLEKDKPESKETKK